MGTWTHPFAVLHLSCQLTINSTTTPHQWPLNSEVRLKIQGGHYTPMSMICSRHTHTYTHTEQSNLQPNTNSVGGKIFQVLLPNQQFNSPDKEMSKVKGHQGHQKKKKKKQVQLTQHLAASVTSGQIIKLTTHIKMATCAILICKSGGSGFWPFDTNLQYKFDLALIRPTSVCREHLHNA